MIPWTTAESKTSMPPTNKNPTTTEMTKICFLVNDNVNQFDYMSASILQSPSKQREVVVAPRCPQVANSINIIKKNFPQSNIIKATNI